MAQAFQDADAPRRIHQLIDTWVQAAPDAPALRDATCALGYGELNAQAIAAARRLQDLGVRAGDRVLLVGENCVAFCMLVLALSRIDAWSIIVNARLSPREIDEFVAHSGARRVIYATAISADALAHARRHGAAPQDWGAIGLLSVGPLNEDAVAEDCSDDPARQVAAMIYTSGTSGTPKGVMLTHANLLFAALSACALRGYRTDDVVYGVLPMAHVVGLSIQLLGTLAGGACLLLEPRFSPAGLAEALARGGITAFTGVPAMYAKLVDHLRANPEPAIAGRLRYASVAGSPLTPSLKADVEQALGIPLHNGYGLTETSPTVAQTRIAQPRQDCAVGPPIPRVETRLVDTRGVDVPPDAVGELWVRGPNVMKGYYRNPALTAQAIDGDGWFNTGDMARRSDDGALHIVGRSKELIIRSGFNVYPVEVEQVLNAHADVVQSAVVGRTVGHNEEVVAFVELAAGAAVDTASLRSWLRERLSPYKVPAEIRVLAQLPAAPSGKVLKNALKDMARQPAVPTA